LILNSDVKLVSALIVHVKTCVLSTVFELPGVGGLNPLPHLADPYLWSKFDPGGGSSFNPPT